MKTTTLTDQHFMLKAIKAELESQIEMEIQNAFIQIQKKLRERIGVMALTLLKEVDVQYSGEFLTIRIRNEMKENP